jgi:1-acyl-sn-glycerol-3-phosphate acyltransferase
MVVSTIVWSLVCLAAPLPYRQRFYITSRWNVFMIWCLKVICGIRYEIRGMENLPDAPAILLSKHQSAWETIFLLPMMPRPLVFVFKKEILYIPFFGWAMALLRMIPIDRKQGKNAFKDVVRHGKRRLAQGLWIIMFPEGTRIPVGKAGKYKSGGTRLPSRPARWWCRLRITRRVLAKNSFIKRPGLVTVSIGKPISSEGQTPDGMMQQVENWIESEMRVISPHAYNAG